MRHKIFAQNDGNTTTSGNLLRHKYILRICLVLPAIALSCCTFNEPRLRPEPIAAALAPAFGRLNGNTITLTDGLKARCVEWHSWTHYPSQYLLEMFTGWHSTMDECVYLTVDPSTIVGTADAASANTIAHETDELIAISDYNCGNFLASAFAAKTGTDFASSLASTILSGSSAVLGLAGGVPALVPSGISAGNSAISGGAAAFDSNFYAKQSFDIMETGILTKRKLQRAEINARICETYKELNRLPPGVKDCTIPRKAGYEGYTPARYWVMSEALSDVMEYDRTCSIAGGLRELSSAAAQEKIKADAASGAGAPAPAATSAP